MLLDFCPCVRIGVATAQTPKALLKALFAACKVVTSGGELEIRNGVIISVSDRGDDVGSLFGKRELKVRLGRERGGVQFFERFGDAFGLGAGKAALLELLDDPVRVDHERLHRPSVYHATGSSQGVARVSAAVQSTSFPCVLHWRGGCGGGSLSD